MKKTSCLSSKRDILTLVKCPAGNDNRARVRPLSHASLDSHSWLSVLPGKGCSRKRLSAFLGRCLWVVNAQADARVDCSTRLAGCELAEAGISSGRHPQAPFCRQGAATPAKHRMSSGREAQRYNSATPQAVRLEASLPTTIVVKGRAA